MDKVVEYTINHRTTDKATFLRFLETLTEIPGTWYCYDMSIPDQNGAPGGGGLTGYKATSKDGVIHHYKESVAPERVEYSITQENDIGEFFTPPGSNNTP